MTKKIFFTLILLIISISVFSQNYSVVENAVGLKGYVNSQNQLIIPNKYSFAGDFIDNLAIVKLEDKFGVINTKDETIIPFEYDAIELLDNGLYKVSKKNKELILNKKGKIVKN